MDIIIDGYNLIGSERGLRGDLEHQRNWLLQRLSLYQEVRGHTVILVFDGWKTGLIDEVSENKQGVRLFFRAKERRPTASSFGWREQKGADVLS